MFDIQILQILFVYSTHFLNGLPDMFRPCRGADGSVRVGPRQKNNNKVRLGSVHFVLNTSVNTEFRGKPNRIEQNPVQTEPNRTENRLQIESNQAKSHPTQPIQKETKQTEPKSVPSQTKIGSKQKQNRFRTKPNRLKNYC